MLGIVLRALRRRRVHAATLFVLGLVAAAAAAAAPGYAIAGAESLAATELGSASSYERVVTVQGDVSLRTDLSTTFGQLDDTVVRTVQLPGFHVVNDARIGGQAAGTRLDLVYREGVCERLTVDGACPTRAGEVAVAQDMATLLKVKIGDQVRFTAANVGQQPTLQVVGIYRPTDPGDPYWGPSETAEDATVTGQRFRPGTAFTPLATMLALRPARLHATIDLIATSDAVRSRNPELLAQSAERAIAPLGAQELDLSTGLRAYADRVLGESNLIFAGVFAATVQLLILAWFALALTVRQTAESRRPDVALLKLRGTGRLALWSLSAGQAALPIATGGLAGLVIGGIGARWWAGPVVDPQMRIVTLAATIGAAAAAALVAVGSALFAERRMLAEPVADLARRVPARRRSWRTGVLDAAVIVLALAAAVELRSTVVASTQFRGLDVLGPTLVALAVGIVAAWLVPRAASLVTRSALRSGRLGLGLGAVHLARRTALPRVLTMLTLAVAVVTGATVTWDITNRAEAQRALVEVGADRVLTVQTMSPASLLAATRAADPQGRYAMAVARTLSGAPVLAVDSSRLAAVVPWSPVYGLPDWSTVAATLRSGMADPTIVHNGASSLDASWTPPHPVVIDDGSVTTGADVAAPVPKRATAPAHVSVVVEHPDGSVVAVDLGLLHAARATYRVTLTGCDPQCRLVGFQLLGPAGIYGGSLELHEFSAAGTVTLAPAQFGDRSRWRTSVAGGAELPMVSTGPAGLALSVDRIANDSETATFGVFLRDAATPVPVYVAGAVPPDALIGEGSVQALGGGMIAAKLAGAAALLPRAGGSGQLVDLESLTRLASGSGRYEVWLAAGTPPAVVQALKDNGLSIVGDDSIAGRVTQLQAQGPPIAARYLLAVALVGLVMAVAAFAVAAAVERSSRADELGSLRRQGLRPGVIATAGYGGYLAFVVVAGALGAVSAVLATRIITPVPRVFGDGWSVLALPTASLAVLGMVAAGLLVVIGAVAALAGAALVRAVRSEGARPAGSAER